MQIVTHQLEFAVDAVVDAGRLFTDVIRGRDRRDVLVCSQIRFGEGTGIKLEHRVGVYQVGGNHIAGEEAARTQTILRVERQLSRIGGFRNFRYGCTCGGIGQVLACRREVAGHDRIDDRRRAALDQSPRFFIPEEECLFAVVVVDVGNDEWTAKVTAELVEMEGRTALASLVGEVVVGVVIGVAVEFVKLPVEVASAGLEDEGDGAAGTNAVVWTVVTIKGLELGNRLLGGQVHKAAAAAAVILLSSVQQVNVVGAAGPIEADTVGRGQGVDPAELRQAAGNTEAEGGEGGHVAAISGELLNLLAADQRTDLTGLGLRLQSIGLHSYGFLRAAHLQCHVGLNSLCDVYDDSGFGELLEAGRSCGQVVRAHSHDGKTIGSCGVGDGFPYLAGGRICELECGASDLRAT